MESSRPWSRRRKAPPQSVGVPVARTPWAGVRAGGLQLPETEIDDTPDSDAVVRALWRKAKAGDTGAAKELRAWLDRDAGSGKGEDVWRELSRRERDDLLDALGVERDTPRAGEKKEGGHPPEA